MNGARTVFTLLCGVLVGIGATVGFTHFPRAREAGALPPPASEALRIPWPDSTDSSIGLFEYAQRVRCELVLIDSATDQWAVENCKAENTPVTAKIIAPYFRQGTALQQACARGECLDSLGNPILLSTIETPPSLSRATFDKLSSVVPPEFWKPYTVQ